jgi:hypothetical protein
MRRIAVSVLSLGLLLGAPAAVLAAAPSNNTYGGRTDIAAIPFNDTIDTTEATAGSNDVEINADCGAPATDASVWYSYTAPSDQDLLADVSQSDYSAGLIVAIGSPGSFQLLTCGPGSVAFPASSGETYTILAFDDQEDGIGNGGTLVFSLDILPPPPTIHINVDPVGALNKQTNEVTVTGTISCSSPAEIQFYGEVKQRAGRQIIFGNLFGDDFCNDVLSFSATTDQYSTGIFAGGKATVHMVAFAFPTGGAPSKASSGGYGVPGPNATGGEGFDEVTVTIRLKVS